MPMNLQTLQSQLTKLERRGRQLQKAISTRTARQYAALPKKVGLKSIDALFLALVPYVSPRARNTVRISNGNGSSAPAKAAKRNVTTGKSKGTRYGADVKAKVTAALRKGDLTAAQISEKYGPSVFSVNAWKANLGLTKSRTITKPVRYAKKK